MFDQDDVENMRQGFTVEVAYRVLDKDGRVLHETDFASSAADFAEKMGKIADPAPVD